MQPETYLLLAAGIGLGLPIGYAIAKIGTALRVQRADRTAWAAAERFYTRRCAEILTSKH